MLKYFNHETPLYCLLYGKDNDCMDILKIYYKEQYVQEVYQETKSQAQKISSSSMQYIDMIKPEFRQRLMIGVTLSIFQQWSGIYAVIMYSGQIFGASIKDFETKNLITLFSNIVLMVACATSGFFVSKIGRKIILQYGSMICAIFLYILCLLSYSKVEGTEKYNVIFIFLYYLAFNFSLGPIVWLYNSEILPEKGISIATLANWFGGTVVTLALPYFSDFWPLFLIFGSVCVCCVFFTTRFLKETLGKSKIEIIRMFENEERQILDVQQMQEIKNVKTPNNLQQTLL
ncbi:major facilitator superfamily protein, putative [Ichthyophthirius multifiliis]|uniref:Major facilitator superfamily protein, putative n=1 Tax=Ichthyophthirius multifiliis TaxID=5932 RepID=G0R102_ICHMU|nr:major facilitator superfamily protein, putative [Ichthyophthirius multifiliis]EGR28867.1 major facilitator superfamily protein, putative [Ichthyophthirius multifiliis]|eukprot:XP_004030103.1 major facilitator superfamily protein, putative [Ichthyophthirius multifiliis]